MKKRMLILGISIFAVAGGVYAGVVMVTSCGKKVTTVGAQYFNYNMEQYRDYAREVNSIYCGEELMPIIESVQFTD